MRNKRTGFSLVELLVVIAIIGLLVQLILPAVQAARETARRTRCQNNLRQIGLACLNHEGVHKHLPVGGWNYRWIGDPDRGFGEDQPGGWIFNILPYLEQQDRRDMAVERDDAEKRHLLAVMSATPIEGFNCPTRRESGPHTVKGDYAKDGYHNADFTARGQVRSDYAINGGTDPQVVWRFRHAFPETLKEADSPDWDWTALRNEESDGVVLMRFPVRLAEITDGQSQTYLAGEKALRFKNYETGGSSGDNGCMLQGFDSDVVRWAAIEGTDTVPQNDGGKGSRHRAFGSAHTNGFVTVHGNSSSTKKRTAEYRARNRRRSKERGGYW